MNSLHALKHRGLQDRYTARAGRALVERLVEIGAPCWLPVDVAEAHYAACDAMGLTPDEVLQIGAAVAPTTTSGIAVLLRAARTSGVTPWTALSNAPRYWARMYDGSAVWIEERGPKDARVHIVKNRLARYRYWRVGLRGIITELARALSSSAYANEVGRTRDDETSYSLSWA